MRRPNSVLASVEVSSVTTNSVAAASRYPDAARRHPIGSARSGAGPVECHACYSAPLHHRSKTEPTSPNVALHKPGAELAAIQSP
jgi:hypothetical protein